MSVQMLFLSRRWCAGIISLIVVGEFIANTAKGLALPIEPSVSSSRLREFDRPARTVKEWLAQVEAATVQVTRVQLNRNETGLDIVLDTRDNKPLQVDATKFRAEGNALIADIPNAVLMLADGQTFNADNPTDEIATVRITQLDAANIRITVTGKTARPTQEVTLRTGALAYSLNPEGDETDEEIGHGRGAARLSSAKCGYGD